MKTFKFLVTQTDTYQKMMTAKANTAEEAEEKIQADLNEQGLETHSNAFVHNTVEFELQTKKGGAKV